MVNLLHIEDKTADQSVFEDCLKNVGIEVKLSTCSNLADAAQQIRSSKFEIIFCDFNLGDESALDLLDKSNIIEEIPIVILSSNPTVDITRDSFKKGAFDLVKKADLNSEVIGQIINSGLRSLKENKLRLDLERRLDGIYANTRTILDNTTDGIWSLDDNGKLLIMNSIARDNIKELGGTFPAIGDQFFDKIHSLFKTIWEPIFERVLKGEDVITVDEYHDGDNRFFLEMACTPITSNKETVGVSFVARNVTEREVSEAKVRESEKNFRSVFTGSEVPIMLTSVKDNKIVDLNEACATLHVYDRNDMIGMSMYETIPKENRNVFEDDFEKYVGGKTSTLETFSLTSASVSIPVALSVTEIFYQEKQCYLIFLYDISLRIETETRLKQARELAEKSAEFKSLFLANMSHEIRTPMNAMLGFADLLKKTKLDNEQKEYIDIIRNSGEDLLVIINDILDLTKIEAGKLTLRPKRFNLVDAINKVIRLHKNNAIEKQIGLILELDGALPDDVYMDDLRLTQILNNLISNALKFTETGAVKVKIALLQKDGERFIEILVKDSGIGIPEIELDTIFENFNQVDSSLQRKQKGTGLGLSIVHQLCDLMGGQIVARSKSGEGSEFEVLLALVEPTDEVEEEDQGEKKEIISDELHVLICEDNPINVMLACKILDDLGIHYKVAKNGKEGVEATLEHKPDVVFMDLQMPVMDGYEAAREIRKHSDVPIIAMSAHVLEEEQNKCIEAGMNGFIPKPFKPEDIINELQNQFSFDKNEKAQKEGNKWTMLNMPGLTNLSKGDEEFAISLFDIFVETAKEDLKIFKAAVDSSDSEKQMSIAHRLLPSFMTFNFVRLHIVAEKIENQSASQEEREFFLEKLDSAISEIIQKRASFVKGR